MSSLEALVHLMEAAQALDHMNAQNVNLNNVKCYCGTKMNKTTGFNAYRNRGGVICDGCMGSVPSNATIFHCPSGKTIRHKNGSDLCVNCARKRARGERLPLVEAKEDTPFLNSPLANVLCKCGMKMEFLPCCAVYKGAVKCDRCKCQVASTSYLFHCPRGQDANHGVNIDLRLNVTPVFWDYCISCGYKKCRSSAPGGSGSGTAQVRFVVEENKEALDNAQKTIENKTIQISKLESQISELKRTVERTKAQYSQNQATTGGDVQKLRRELQESRDTNQTLRAMAQSANSEMQNKDAIIASLRHAMDEMKSESENRLKTRDITGMLEYMIETVSKFQARLDELRAGTKTNDCLPNLMSMHAKCDELYRQCNQLETIVASLKALYAEQLRSNRQNWKEWNSDEVVDWIIGLEEGRYRKYQRVLRRQMALRNFKGKHLGNLGMTHLESFGIMDWDDGSSLIAHVKSFVSSSSGAGEKSVEGKPNNFVGY